VKYGVTAAELFASLGLALTGHSLEWMQASLDRCNLALVHQPDHFPAAEQLIPYRDEIGKRPPLASLELMWTAHHGKHLLVSGFVHPPTEARAWKALELAGEHNLFTVKGLEGSTDLPISRACVTGRVQPDGEPERLVLHPRDHGCYGTDPAWQSLEHWSQQAMAALGGQGELAHSLRWNSGTYLWQAGAAANLQAGVEQVDALLQSGAALRQLEQMRQQLR
jgi:anthranilate phosphoribosyltransferase